jgi:hypothetical protein
MTVTLKNFEIQNIMDVLGELSQQDLDDIKISYRIGKVIKVLSSHSEDYQESRKTLVEKHAKKKKNGDIILATDEDGKEIEGSVQLEDQEKFNEEILKILNDEVEVQIPVTLSVDLLADAGVKLKPHRVVILEPLFDDGGE